MHRIPGTCLVLFLGLAAVKSLPAAAPDAANSSTVTLDKRTQIPGDTLKPGTYSVQVLDHLSDRMIIRMEDTKGKTHTVFLAVPNTMLAGRASAGGAIIWKTDLNGSPALRGFKFPSGYTVEFVYPKAEAAALAKSNEGNVLAVDPESEGKPELRHMSPDDMQMVHLWMLSLSTAGPDDKAPAIQAQAYQAPAKLEPVQLASNSVPPAPQAGLKNAGVVDRVSPSVPRQAPKKHSVVAVLPHTAGSLPLLALAALTSLIAALLLHLRLAVLQRSGTE